MKSLADGGFQTGSMMGSGGFIVLDEDQCVVRHTLTLARFYRHESCGQCSPCREGTGWMEKILNNIEYGKGKMSDIDLLWDIQRRIEGNTICPLGDAAAWPVAAAIRHFRDEFEWHVLNPDEAQRKKLRPGQLCTATGGSYFIVSFFTQRRKEDAKTHDRKRIIEDCC
jgi:NADH-quinone oxidoreductase subunit F